MDSYLKLNRVPIESDQTFSDQNSWGQLAETCGIQNYWDRPPKFLPGAWQSVQDWLVIPTEAAEAPWTPKHQTPTSEAGSEAT